MVTATTAYADVPKPENALRAFDVVNLFVAGALGGFGPFVALFLAQQGWPPGRIGFALTAGTVWLVGAATRRRAPRSDEVQNNLARYGD